MYWSGIRSFIAVAEHGSFTAAAGATGLSKASLSQQVSELESQLGVQLLHRTARQLRLTELGRGYLERCRQGMDLLDNAGERVSQSTDAMAGTIRVNAVGGLIGEELIAPLLISFQQQYPEIDIQLDFSSQREDLLSSHYDLVMRMGELPDSTLVARRLHTITTRYVASPDFINTQARITHPRDLVGLPLIYGSVSEWQFFRHKEWFTVHAGQGFQIANGRVMYQAALAGQGIARLSDVYVQGAIDTGLLKEVLPDWSLQTPLWLVCPPGRHQLQRIRGLMDWLVDNFSTGYQEMVSHCFSVAACSAKKNRSVSG